MKFKLSELIQNFSLSLQVLSPLPVLYLSAKKTKWTKLRFILKYKFKSNYHSFFFHLFLLVAILELSFHLAYSFLHYAKYFKLRWSHFFFICLFLFPLVWEVGHRGSCYDLCQSFLPMFSSKSCIVSSLTFRSLIHFEFIFVYGVRKCSRCILLHVFDQFSQHHLLKTLSFLHCVFCLLYQR